jgi:hypothetical protein
MKKIILIISLFFLIPLNSSISAPIKLLGLDATMDVKTINDILTKKNYNCSILSKTIMSCYNNDNDSPTKLIDVAKETISFNCEVYNGCKYNSKEVAKFFSESLNFKIKNTELIGEYNIGICGEGPDGDKLCVVSSLIDTLGPAIFLMKHKLGGSGMTLN